MGARIETFDDFWPHYVRAHRHPSNRALHHAGTTAAIAALTAAVTTVNPAWLVVAAVAGYGPSWVGHFVFEKNRPATWEHPLWSLRADLTMYSLALQRKMAAEVERLGGGAVAPDRVEY